jgi:oxaloacetate decarboxylase alpha subunit
VFNVLFGRYNRLSGEFQDLLAGKYGACPAPKNQDVVKKALEALKMDKEITHRPADDIPSEFAKLEEEAKKLLGTGSVAVEDVLTYAMFPKVAPNFFKKRSEGPVVFKPEPDAPAVSSGGAAKGQAEQYNVNVNGTNYAVVVSPAGTVALAPSGGAAIPAASAGSVPVPAPVAGTILRYAVDEGADVKSGQTVIIMESMKMELEIKATDAGKIRFIVPAGTQVAAGQTVAELGGVAGAAPPPAASGEVPAAVPSAAASGGAAVPAPVAGTVLRYAVDEGAQVNSGDTIVIMESMKMELEIKATAAGKVHFLAPLGAQVASQQPLAELQ